MAEEVRFGNLWIESADDYEPEKCAGCCRVLLGSHTAGGVNWYFGIKRIKQHGCPSMGMAVLLFDIGICGTDVNGAHIEKQNSMMYNIHNKNR